jgi:hypothetical protein
VRQAAHIVGCTSFAATGASLVGATATAEAAGPVHVVFAVGVLGSLLTMVAALVVHGPDMLRCRRCMHQTAQTLSNAAPAEVEQPAQESAEPVPTHAWWAA